MNALKHNKYLSDVIIPACLQLIEVRVIVSAEVSALLNSLEETLQSEGHWAGMPPSVEALSSAEPFCVDTLDFTQWLQWIYIPRMRAIIDQHAPLPSGSQIQPYAEEAFGAQRIDGSRLLPIIASLDAAMA